MILLSVEHVHTRKESSFHGGRLQGIGAVDDQLGGSPFFMSYPNPGHPAAWKPTNWWGSPYPRRQDGRYRHAAADATPILANLGDRAE